MPGTFYQQYMDIKKKKTAPTSSAEKKAAPAPSAGTLEAGPPRTMVDKFKQAVRERTGLFEPPVYGQDFRETQPVKTLGRAAAHYSAATVAGLGLHIPDILANKISGQDGLV